MKNKPTPKELQAALDGAGVSLENLKQRIRQAAGDVPKFSTNKDGQCGCYVYCADVKMLEGGTWCAYIGAADGNTYEQDFTIDGDSVKFAGDPREVIANTEYTPVQAGDVPGHEFHGNQHTSGESAKADSSTHKASADTLKAVASGTKEDHDSAARSNHDAATAHLLARDASVKGSKEYQAHQNAIKFHEDRAAGHEKASAHLDATAGAVGKSEDANAKSKTAIEKNDVASHEAAADAHTAAAEAHNRLAEKSMNAGDKDAEASHRNAAKQHANAAYMHNQQASALRDKAKAKPAEASSQEKAPRSFEAEVMAMSEAADVFNGFMAMAGGIQTMTLGCDGKPVTVTIDVNPAGAQALQAQLETINRSTQQKAFNCFFHEKKAASSWPKKFFWQDARDSKKPGIYEAAEPSEDGKKAVVGKTCRGFSLTFFTNADPQPLPLDAGWMIPPGEPGSPENPAQIICPADVAENPTKYLNMGTLTNRPASTKNQPLFASHDTAAKNLPAPVAPARAGAHSSNRNTKKTMETKPLDAAALQARNVQLEQKITALEAEDTAIAKAQLEAAQAELRENNTKLELAAAQAKIAESENEKQKQLEASADAAVSEMIEAQQIPALDRELQAQWKKDFIANPGLIARVVKPKGGASARRVTPGATGVELNAGVHVDPFGFSVPTEMKQLLEIIKRNANVRLMPGIMSKAQLEAAYEEKGKFALMAGQLYKKALKPHEKDWSDIPPIELAKCVGLDAQAMSFNRRAFEAADYLDPNNQFQTLNGTLVLQRTLPLFAYDYPELLGMYTDFSDAPGLYQQTEQSRVVNIPAVLLYNAGLDANGRPIGFVVSSPASTVDAPLTLSAYIAVPIVIGQATLSSTQRRLFDEIAPAGIKAIASYFVGMVTVLLTPANYNSYAAVTAPDANGVVSVPVAYATYAKGLTDFSMTDLDKLSAIFTQNKVPRGDRGILLNTQYYAKLRSDPRLEFFFAAAKGDPQLTQQKLPEGLSGFMPYEAPYLPQTNNLAFFPFHKAGIMLKSRLPMDFSTAVNALIPGSITTVTDPDTKISVALVQRVDLVGNYAEWRPEVQLGANKGDGRGGLCGTTQ